MKTSEILSTLFNEPRQQNYSINELCDKFKGRSFGFILILMALPNALMLGSVPGISTFFGSVIIFVSIQMIQQKSRLWLPKRLGQMNIPKTKIDDFIKVGLPYVKKIEKFCKARWSSLPKNINERWLGIFCLFHGILIALPIPFANFTCGLILLILASGMVMNDGIMLLIGLILSLCLFGFICSGFYLICGVVYEFITR